MYGFNPFSTTAFSEVEVAQSYSLSASAGSYTITGGTATFTRTRVLNGAAGSYTLTGKAATFRKGYGLSGGAGAYSFVGNNAELTYTPIIVEMISKGGLPKAKSTKKYKEESELRAELEKIVKDEFDKLDGTYQPEVVEKVKDVFIPEIKQIDLNEYNAAIAQVNALLLQIKIRAAEYEAELDDEEAVLMLL